MIAKHFQDRIKRAIKCSHILLSRNVKATVLFKLWKKRSVAVYELNSSPCPIVYTAAIQDFQNIQCIIYRVPHVIAKSGTNALQWDPPAWLVLMMTSFLPNPPLFNTTLNSVSTVGIRLIVPFHKMKKAGELQRPTTQRVNKVSLHTFCLLLCFQTPSRASLQDFRLPQNRHFNIVQSIVQIKMLPDQY